MKYDAVIIGGGASGCAEAISRYDKGQKVCVVTAGLTLHSLEPGFVGQPYKELKTLTDLGIAVLRGDTVVSGDWEGMTLKEVHTANGVDLQADQFILATGRFFSKGLVADMQGIREPLFGADVDAPEDRTQWFNTDFFAPQPFESYGVKTTKDGRIYINGTAAENVFAIGKILGGRNNADS